MARMIAFSFSRTGFEIAIAIAAGTKVSDSTNAAARGSRLQTPS